MQSNWYKSLFLTLTITPSHYILNSFDCDKAKPTSKTWMRAAWVREKSYEHERTSWIWMAGFWLYKFNVLMMLNLPFLFVPTPTSESLLNEKIYDSSILFLFVPTKKSIRHFLNCLQLTSWRTKFPCLQNFLFWQFYSYSNLFIKYSIIYLSNQYHHVISLDYHIVVSLFTLWSNHNYQYLNYFYWWNIFIKFKTHLVQWYLSN